MMETLYDLVIQQVKEELNKDADIFDVLDRINEMTNVELLEKVSRALEEE